MKKVSVLFATVMVVVSVLIASCDSKTRVSLKNDVDSASYALGVMNGDGFGRSLKEAPGDPIDVDLLIAGFIQGMKNDTAAYKMTPMEAQGYIQNYFQNAQTRDMERTKEEGETFLENNKAASGVITTESGLQYKVITEGNGPRPTENDRVKVHYTGTLLDGTVFDSSVERGEPATFGVTQVIPGWTEALQLMTLGSKYILWIPSDLAYGPRGSQNIKPNSTLKFEVELLEIEQ